MTARSSLADPARLLAAWEAGAAAPELARGCAVLAAAGLADTASLLDLPLGTVAISIQRCHLTTFGPQVDAVTACQACGITLDVGLSLTGLRPDPADPPADPDPTRALELTGGTITVRPPTVRDLLAAAADPDPQGVLVRRCAQRSGPERQPVEVTDLGPGDLALVDEALEDLAGLGLITVSATCPGCGEPVAAMLDPAALLWQQVERAAPALLRDVATLAAAFGWPEREILALPAVRRRAYLQLVAMQAEG
jgi:hypothetical protein